METLSTKYCLHPSIVLIRTKINQTKYGSVIAYFLAWNITISFKDCLFYDI